MKLSLLCLVLAACVPPPAPNGAELVDTGERIAICRAAAMATDGGLAARQAVFDACHDGGAHD